MSNGSFLIWPLTIQLALIIISASFTCAEISLLTVNRNKLEGLANKGNKKAKRLFSLTGEPAKFLATIQVGNTLAGFLGSAFAADFFSGKLAAFLYSRGVNLPLTTLNTISVILIVITLSYFTMVLSELLPKRIAIKKAETLSFVFSGPILVVSKLFSPVVWLLTNSTNALLRLFGIDPKADTGAITEEEIRLMIDLGSAGGAIKKIEKDILHNVFEFHNKSAGEVMTHRRDVIFLNFDDNDHEWERIITESRHNIYPVCGKGPDDIKGILNIRDYLVMKDRSREAVMNVLRPAHFVPLTVRTDKIFWQMKKSRNHFSIVVDEHGSMMGIITMNNLLEELVGNLDDDSTLPLERPLIEKADIVDIDKGWYINGAAPLDLVARELDFKMPLTQYDTFAGLVFSLLGHVPADGHREELEYTESSVPEQEASRLHIQILEVKERRLEKAFVRKIIYKDGEA